MKSAHRHLFLTKATEADQQGGSPLVPFKLFGNACGPTVFEGSHCPLKERVGIVQAFRGRVVRAGSNSAHATEKLVPWRKRWYSSLVNW
jgi:hypothetical protein